MPTSLLKSTTAIASSKVASFTFSSSAYKNDFAYYELSGSGKGAVTGPLTGYFEINSNGNAVINIPLDTNLLPFGERTSLLMRIFRITDYLNRGDFYINDEIEKVI